MFNKKREFQMNINLIALILTANFPIYSIIANESLEKQINCGTTLLINPFSFHVNLVAEGWHTWTELEETREKNVIKIEPKRFKEIKSHVTEIAQDSKARAIIIPTPQSILYIDPEYDISRKLFGMVKRSKYPSILPNPYLPFLDEKINSTSNRLLSRPILYCDLTHIYAVQGEFLCDLYNPNYAFSNFFEKLQPIAESIAKEQGACAVLSKENTSYIHPDYDVTEHIINRLNSENCLPTDSAKPLPFRHLFFIDQDIVNKYLDIEFHELNEQLDNAQLTYDISLLNENFDKEHWELKKLLDSCITQKNFIIKKIEEITKKIAQQKDASAIVNIKKNIILYFDSPYDITEELIHQFKSGF